MNQDTQYNAREPQTFPFEVTFRNKKYRVAHSFDPLTDDLLVEYDRRCQVRYGEADRKESDGGGIARTNQNFAAAVWLWDSLIQNVEGYGPLEGVDWKGKVSDKFKAAAIDNALLACSIEEGGEVTEAPEGEYLPLDEQGAATIKLRSIFSGREVITEHVLREPNTEQMSRFQSLMSRSLIVKGRKLGRPETRIPSKARPLAKIYDELYESTSGYAEGGIPLHHKIAVINHHMTAQQEVLEGN